MSQVLKNNTAFNLKMMINAIVLKCEKSYLIGPTVKYTTQCNICISFVQTRKLLELSQRAQGIVQAP